MFVSAELVSAGEARGGGETDARLEEIAAEGRALATELAVLQSRLVALAAEARAYEGRLASGTLRQWLAWQWGLTPAEAARTVRLARRLDALPALRGELAAGRLSEGTVATLAAVATPDNERRLIETAEVACGSQLQTLTRDLRRVLDADAQTGSRDQTELPESLSWWTDEAGRFRLSGRLDADRGAAFTAAIDAARDRDFDDAGAGAQPLSNPEALSAVLDGYLTGLADGRGVVPSRFLTVVHHDTATGTTCVGDHGPVCDEVAGQLLCESWVAAVVSRGGRPLTGTSPTRLATPAQHRALRVRDRCCRFPGCGRTRHLRAHHLVHASRHGPTRLDNLVLLCPIHHRLVHRRGWDVTGRPPDQLIFTGPHGPLKVPKRPPDAGRPGEVVPRERVARDRLTNFGRDVVLHHWLN